MSDIENKDEMTAAERKALLFAQEKEKEEAEKARIHEERMANSVEYRRSYYLGLLEQEKKMRPRELYERSEYEAVESIYNKHVKMMETKETVEEMEAVLQHAKKKFKKILSSQKVFGFFLASVVIILVVLIVLAYIFAYTK